MDNTQKRSLCRVCGWLFNSPVRDEEGFGSYDICPACGCEAGNHDWTLEDAREYRQQWIANGMKWWFPDPKVKPIPKNWDPVEQMKNIPPEWR